MEKELIKLDWNTIIISGVTAFLASGAGALIGGRITKEAALKGAERAAEIGIALSTIKKNDKTTEDFFIFLRELGDNILRRKTRRDNSYPPKIDRKKFARITEYFNLSYRSEQDAEILNFITELDELFVTLEDPNEWGGDEYFRILSEIEVPQYNPEYFLGDVSRNVCEIIRHKNNEKNDNFHSFHASRQMKYPQKKRENSD